MIAVIDYGMGNLRSVQKGLERAGADARITSRGDDVEAADKIVLPGVAAFGDAMRHLHELELVEPIRRVTRAGTPYLGFCLGLQMLFDRSYEHGEFEGLGLVAGEVVKFDFSDLDGGPKLAIPHMGWNQIRFDPDTACPMLRGLHDGDYAYFAHSYHVVPADPAATVTTTEYGHSFTSSIWQDNIFATQFHPEKSQDVGLRLLENFVRL